MKACQTQSGCRFFADLITKLFCFCNVTGGVKKSFHEGMIKTKTTIRCHRRNTHLVVLFKKLVGSFSELVRKPMAIGSKKWLGKIQLTYQSECSINTVMCDSLVQKLVPALRFLRLSSELTA